MLSSQQRKNVEDVRHRTKSLRDILHGSFIALNDPRMQPVYDCEDLLKIIDDKFPDKIVVEEA